MHQATFLDYDGFVEKFKPKKTTDDCYTPDIIYNAVRAWAVATYKLEGREIVRPFWPGGDYQAFDYPPGAVVIDNPPFSILSSIIRWYNAAKIDYFLFSPYLTNLGLQGCNHVIAPVSITYANGARVDTSFVTNLGEFFILGAVDLYDRLVAAEKENTKKDKRTLPKYEYPDEVITSAAVGYLTKHHTPFAVRREDCAFIRKLDAQSSSSIFGGGYLLSRRCAAERAAAERAAAERWVLSERERQLSDMLGGGN